MMMLGTDLPDHSRPYWTYQTYRPYPDPTRPARPYQITADPTKDYPTVLDATRPYQILPDPTKAILVRPYLTHCCVQDQSSCAPMLEHPDTIWAIPPCTLFVLHI